LLCAAPGAGDACGTCAHCTRVGAGTHPDLHLLAREPERRDIRIEQVRELTRWLTLQPLMAARKVGVLDDAHCLSEQAQNALLKTLEEPPGATVLVLVASSAALLLPTVRSRCQVVRLDPLPAPEVVRVLEASGVPAGQARELAPLAEGSPGRALALAGEAETRARACVLRDLPRLRELGADELSRTAQELSRGALDAGLATALAWYRDVLETALAGDAAPLRNPAAADDVRRAARRLSPAALLRQLEAVYATIVALEKNANRMLAVETMLLSLRALERVIKKADSRDLAREDQNLQRERQHYGAALELVRGRNLAVKLVKAESAFDASKVTFFFAGAERVDLRDLGRELADLLRTRVEMKQIGARDETKVTGGIGPCGRELCCSSWLQEFQPVSVKMAKEQGLSLNPSKLAGMCGRLKCCLRYEYQTYVELKKVLPAVGTPVESVKGDGTVVRQNVLRQTVVVRRSEDNVEVEATRDDLVVRRADA